MVIPYLDIHEAFNFRRADWAAERRQNACDALPSHRRRQLQRKQMEQLPDIAARPHGKILVETRVAEGNAAADLERGASQTPPNLSNSTPVFE